MATAVQYKVKISPSIVLSSGGQELPVSSYGIWSSANGFSAECNDNMLPLDPGMNLVVVAAKGDYTGTINRDVEAYIDPSIASILIESRWEYTGSLICPIPAVIVGGNLIRPSYDAKIVKYPTNEDPLIVKSYGQYDCYLLLYADNTDVGTASVIVQPTSTALSYGATPLVSSFEIYAYELTRTRADILGELTSMDYVGSPLQLPLSIYVNGNLLLSGTDYVVGYLHNDLLGEASYSISGQGNFIGTISDNQFLIWGNIDDTSVNYSHSLPYTGNIEHPPYITVKLSNMLLFKDVDYTVAYLQSDYVHPGQKSFTLTGIESRYIKGTKEFPYSLIGDIEEASVFGVRDFYIATGQDVKPKFDIIFHDLILVDGNDYTVTYPSLDYSTPGRKTICVSGDGYYKNSIDIEYEVYSKEDAVDTLVTRVDGTVQVVTASNLTREVIGIDEPSDRRITYVVVGSSVTSLQDGLFANLKQLRYVDFRNADPDLDLPDGCFDGCIRLKRVFWPGETIDDKAYTLVDYAIGNGGFIDTGYMPTSRTKVTCKMDPIENYTDKSYFGFYAPDVYGSNACDFRFCAMSSNSLYARVGKHSIEWQLSFSSGSWHNVQLDSGTVTVDSWSKTLSYPVDYSLKILNHTVCVFGQENSTISFKLSSFAIVEGSTTVMSLLPAIDAAGIGCLVDTKTGKKFYSANGIDIVCSTAEDASFVYVELDPNGGTTNKMLMQVKRGTTVTLPKPTTVGYPVRSGYSFAGWIDAVTGSTIDKITNILHDVVCVALWNAVSYITVVGGGVVEVDVDSDHILRRSSRGFPTVLTSIMSLSVSNDVVGLAPGLLSATAGVTSNLTSVYLPDSISAIPNACFRNNSRLWFVEASNLKSIGDNAFYGDGQLTSIGSVSSLTSIGSNAFYNCIALQLPDLLCSIQSIGKVAFYYCYKILDIGLNNELSSIPDLAFYRCINLSSIQLPSSLASIGLNAFYSTALKSIYIPNNVTSIANSAFRECLRLSSVYTDSIDSWTSISFSNIESNPLHYAKSLYRLDGSLVEDVVVSENAGYVNAFAFIEADCIKTLSICRGVDSIQLQAFQGCHLLSSIAFNNDLTEIGTLAFYQCTSLTGFNCPTQLESIGQAAFRYCTSLSSIVIDSSALTSIGNNAFGYCDNMTSFTLSNYSPSLKIGSGLLLASGIRHANIGIGIETLSTVFYGCTNLSSIVVPFVGCTNNEAGSTTSLSLTGSWHLGYNFVNKRGYGSIPSSLVEVTLLDGNALHRVPSRSFYKCTYLSSIAIEEGMTTLCRDAFSLCTSLQLIVLPSSISSITSPFYYCSSLTSILFRGKSIDLVRLIWDFEADGIQESLISCEIVEDGL